MTQNLEHRIVISAPPGVVWEVLTQPELMKQWMGEPEMAVHVETSWTVGSPIVVRAFHHAKFENRGTVLRFDPTEVLRYSQLSSLSQLSDTPENYSIFEFRLEPVGDATSLTMTVSGFPTASIFKHLEVYWRGTISILKKLVEKRGSGLAV